MRTAVSLTDGFNPQGQTRPELKRSVFVAIGAGGASLTGTIAAALAQASGFGKPHPPIVPESDPAIVVEHPKLARPGIALPAYAAAPKNATKATPGVVLVQHIFGVDGWTRDVVRRFAKEGFVTIAPLLFARTNPPDGDTDDYKIFLPQAQALQDDVVNGDLAAAADWIRKRAGVAPNVRPPKIGITGFCMGGRIALRQTWQNPAPYDAAAIWYGEVLRQEVERIAMPIEGNFGGRDRGPAPENVRAFEAKLKAPHDIKIYDEAGHAFFDDTRDAYVASAAADAWTRTLAFFRKYLTA